ncbi:MAG: DUF1176 domain-containing protein [Bacteriovorax sp.]|nr:DUF1176 domain-containing protein [Bacteriovorax sp.]
MKLRLILSAIITLVTLSAFGADKTPIQIPKAVLDRHNASCPEFSSEQGKYMTKEVYTLPKGEYSQSLKSLYILGCELFAYNSMEKAYIVDSYGDIANVVVAEVVFDKSITATSDLMGTSFDQASLMLSTYSKGRGMGDCGSSAAYQYDANYQNFFLLEARLKNNCDGDMESQWPVVYSK